MEVPPFDRALEVFAGAAEYSAAYEIPISDVLGAFWDDVVTKAEAPPPEGWWGDTLFLADACEDAIDWQVQCESRPEPISDNILAFIEGVEPIPITPEFVREYVEKMREFALKKNYGAPEEFIDALNFGQLARGVSIMYRVLRPPSESRMGQLGKFGTWVVDKVKKWIHGEKAWREMLPKIMDIYGYGKEPFTMSRRARFLTAFSKFFMAQYLAWWACEELEKTPDGLFKLLTRLAEFLIYIDTPVVLGKLFVIRYGMAEYMAGAETNCVLLSVVKPLLTSLEDMRRCWEDFIDTVVADYAEYAWTRYGYTYRSGYEDMSKFFDMVFTDPARYAKFYVMYSNARTGMELRDAYIYLSEALGIPPYRVVAIIRFLRRYGMFPYPEKLMVR